nr:hypothetical protein [uncultured Solibaculum sp.]
MADPYAIGGEYNGRSVTGMAYDGHVIEGLAMDGVTRWVYRASIFEVVSCPDTVIAGQNFEIKARCSDNATGLQVEGTAGSGKWLTVTLVSKVDNGDGTANVTGRLNIGTANKRTIRIFARGTQGINGGRSLTYIDRPITITNS